MTSLLQAIEKKYLKAEPPKFEVGDTVKVNVLIREGGKERVQAFEGVVIAMRGTGSNKSFSVRRVFQGVGVERTFVLHSPKVEQVKIIRKGKTRRSKLYFLRERIGSKASRLAEDTAKAIKHMEDEAKAKKIADEALRKQKEEEKKAKAEAAAKAKAEAEAKAKAEAAEKAKSESEPKADA